MPINAIQQHKTVADPIASYESMIPIWRKNRAICAGERYAKEFDNNLDTLRFSNLLVPFSTNMTPSQYEFYKAEAELPGITAEYAKMLVGGLLRKRPQLRLPEDAPEGALDWLLNDFAIDGGNLSVFLDTLLWEEMQTSRSWIQIDYPKIINAEMLTREEFLNIKPYPVMWKAENIINWSVGNDEFGKFKLTRVVIRNYEEDFSINEFHPQLVDVVYVHDLFEGKYRIRKYKAASTTIVEVVNGQKITRFEQDTNKFELVDETNTVLVNGEPLSFIPIWPSNGNIEVIEPVLTPLIDKEISLYNKLSRRNHLLYGAATYTPWIASDMTDDDFEETVRSGLGTWLRLRQGDAIGVLETPSAALADMDRAIAAGIEEMARMGIRMLSPETAQSGVALQLRNAAQTAKLGALNNRISTVFQDIFAFMLNWRYGTEYKASDITFSMSDDFSPIPLGETWLRLATEWYEGGLIPRSIWLQILKQNDIIPPEYNDEEGKVEITEDEMVITRQEQSAFNNSLSSQV